MNRPLGHEQLRVLCMVASPTCLLMTPDKASRSLVRMGLLRERVHGPSQPGKPLRSACGITAAGLRRLADEMDAGRVADAIEHWRTEVDERRARNARPDSLPTNTPGTGETT